jgi:N,N'-diacetyllegionaminate synthase
MQPNNTIQRRFSFHSLVAKGVYIIAEAGVNHDGNTETAYRMVKAAASMKADAVKFQLFQPALLVTPDAPKCQYQQTNDKTAGAETETQAAMLERLAIGAPALAHLQHYCHTLNLDFTCSPFDAESAATLHDSLKLPYLKLGSGELDNIPLLRNLAQQQIPLLLSTGMATLEEVLATAQFLKPFYGQHFVESVAFMHCTSQYPAPIESVNMRALVTLQQALPGHIIGYSDHTLSVDSIPTMAVALGAKLYEKHFTLDSASTQGPDHAASIEPRAFKKMVESIRTAELALGTGIKVPHECELGTRQVARKSVVLRYNVEAGKTLTAEDICTKRPATGISARYFDSLIGKQINQSLTSDTILLPQHIQGKAPHA